MDNKANNMANANDMQELKKINNDIEALKKKQDKLSKKLYDNIKEWINRNLIGTVMKSHIYSDNDIVYIVINDIKSIKFIDKSNMIVRAAVRCSYKYLEYPDGKFGNIMDEKDILEYLFFTIDPATGEICQTSVETDSITYNKFECVDNMHEYDDFLKNIEKRKSACDKNGLMLSWNDLVQFVFNGRGCIGRVVDYDVDKEEFIISSSSFCKHVNLKSADIQRC